MDIILLTTNTTTATNKEKKKKNIWKTHKVFHSKDEKRKKKSSYTVRYDMMHFICLLAQKSVLLRGNS